MTEKERAEFIVNEWGDSLFNELDLWDLMVSNLPDSPEPAIVGEVEVVPDMWYDGENILCRTEEIADALMDWMESHGIGLPCSGYYDPEEDEREDCVDDHTGWWYVSVE